MKIVRIPLVLVLLIISLASILILKFSSPLLLFSLLYTIILSIVFGSYRSFGDQDYGVWPSFQDSYYEVGVNEYYDDMKDDNDKDDRYDDDEDGDDVYDEKYGSDGYDEDGDDVYDEKYGSDGYDEDDDDNGSDDEIGWEEDDDEEELDENLQKRIEDFIAKVNKGWREERLKEAEEKQSSDAAKNQFWLG